MPVMLGGSRHYGLVSTDPWECPACGAEQTGPLPDGCTACGSGKPGRKIDESVAADLQIAITVAQAFSDWFARQRSPNLADAFAAGYAHALSLSESVPITAALSEVPRDVPLTPSGIQARTLAAALALFIEQALVNQPEEIESGEWLDVAAARELLAQLQTDGQR